MSLPFVGAVTGANRGIGFALVRELCRRVEGPAVIYLLARTLAKAREAVLKLQQEDGASTTLKVVPTPAVFDLDDSTTMVAFAHHIRATHGGLNVFVNNAGATSPLPAEFDAAKVPKPTAETIQRTVALFHANNVGQRALIDAVFPLMRPSSNFLLFASSFGKRKTMVDEGIKARLSNPALSLDDVDALVREYLDDVNVMDTNAHNAKWVGWPNLLSKTLQVAGMKALCNDKAAHIKENAIFVVGINPGWTITDATADYLDADNKFGDIQAVSAEVAVLPIADLALAASVDTRAKYHGWLVTKGNIEEW